MTFPTDVIFTVTASDPVRCKYVPSLPVELKGFLCLLITSLTCTLHAEFIFCMYRGYFLLVPGSAFIIILIHFFYVLHSSKSGILIRVKFFSEVFCSLFSLSKCQLHVTTLSCSVAAFHLPMLKHCSWAWWSKIPQPHPFALTFSL